MNEALPGWSWDVLFTPVILHPADPAIRVNRQVPWSVEEPIRQAAWGAIDPAALVQDDPTATCFWYWDSDPFYPGDLAIWVDGQGLVVRFQLVNTPAVGSRQLFASWEVGTGLHAGEVDGPDGYPPHSVVRRRVLADAELAALRDYVDAIDEVPPEQRAAIVSRLTLGQ